MTITPDALVVPFFYRGDDSRPMRVVVTGDNDATVEEPQGSDALGVERWSRVEMEGRDEHGSLEAYAHEWAEMVACALAHYLRARLPSGDAPPPEPSNPDDDALDLVDSVVECLMGTDGPLGLAWESSTEEQRDDMRGKLFEATLGSTASRPPGGDEPGLTAKVKAFIGRVTKASWDLDPAYIVDELQTILASEGAAPDEIMEHAAEIAEAHVGPTDQDVADRVAARGEQAAHTQGVTAGVDALLDLIKFHGLSLPAVEHNRADLRADAICNAIEGARLPETQERETAITQALSGQEYVPARSRWLTGVARPSEPDPEHWRDYIGSLAGSMDSDARALPEGEGRAALQDYSDRLTLICGGDTTVPTSARHPWTTEPQTPTEKSP